MVIMVLNPSPVKSLIVVSVAVVLFALAVGLVFETDNKDTITAIANIRRGTGCFCRHKQGWRREVIWILPPKRWKLKGGR